MQRVSVVGNSGSGKTTFAMQLAHRLNSTHIELDSIFHQEGWTQRDTESFRLLVDEYTSHDSWVACGNYKHVIDIVWSRADTIVVFDFPRRIVMWRVIKRTLSRFIKREELWNGNREPFRNFIALHDPEKSIISWAWTKHGYYHHMFHAAQELNTNPNFKWVFLTSPREVKAFLDNCSR